MKLIGRIVCYFKGHKRGKRTGVTTADGRKVEYVCPRCRAIWARKVKVA